MKINSILLFVLLGLNTCFISVRAQPDKQASVTVSGLWNGGSAPVGVMGDHLHPKGGFMFSYRYMNMFMPGLIEGTRKADNDELFDRYNFMMLPQEMTMQMHMVGAMYALHDRFTLMVMLNYLQLDMEVQSRPMEMHEMMGHLATGFSTGSQGIGDIPVKALIGLWKKNGQSVHINTGISIPAGSVDRKDDTPMGEDSQLPYSMQLGSGTWDLLADVTYLGHSSRLLWGTQLASVIHTGENDHGYRLGNKLSTNIWTVYQWAGWMNATLRASGIIQGGINGEDENLNPMMSPATDPANYRRETLLLGAGINAWLSRSKGVSLGAEFELPIYQHVHGVHMGYAYTATLGLRWTIGNHNHADHHH